MNALRRWADPTGVMRRCLYDPHRAPHKYRELGCSLTHTQPCTHVQEACTHTCMQALQWRAHRDPRPKHTWREAWGEQPLSCADRPKAAGPDVLDTDAHPAPQMGGAPQFLSGPSQPLPLWPGLGGPRPPGKSCTRGYWGPGFSGAAVTEMYAFVLNYMRGLRRGSHYLKWRNGALGAQV